MYLTVGSVWDYLGLLLWCIRCSCIISATRWARRCSCPWACCESTAKCTCRSKGMKRLGTIKCFFILSCQTLSIQKNCLVWYNHEKCFLSIDLVVTSCKQGCSTSGRELSFDICNLLRMSVTFNRFISLFCRKHWWQKEPEAWICHVEPVLHMNCLEEATGEHCVLQQDPQLLDDSLLGDTSPTY